MLLWGMMLACAPEDVDAPVEDASEAETEWITDLAVVSVPNIGTTLEVTFETAAEGPAWVEYSIDGGGWEQTPPTASDTAHRVAVITAPYAEVVLRVVADLEGAPRESGDIAATAGGLPPEAPDIEITVNQYTPPADALLLLSVFGSPVYAVMMDFDGTMRWAHPHNAIGAEAEGGLCVAQSIVPGQLLVNVFTPGEPFNDSAELRRINLFGEAVETIATPHAHHFFAEGPTGDILWLRYDSRKQGETTVTGDELMMLPAGGGESVSLANLWDLLPSPSPDSGADQWDWTHANWLQYSPERDSFLMATAQTNLLMEFAPDGTLLQSINGFQSPVTGYGYDDVSEAFGYPHGVYWSADGKSLLMFQRRDGVSSAARYTLDEDNRWIDRTWSYGTDKQADALVLGEMQELSDGNFLISWGGLGILQVVTPAQEVLWEARTSVGSFFTHITVITDPYNSRL